MRTSQKTIAAVRLQLWRRAANELAKSTKNAREVLRVVRSLDRRIAALR